MAEPPGRLGSSPCCAPAVAACSRWLACWMRTEGSRSRPLALWAERGDSRLDARAPLALMGIHSAFGGPPEPEYVSLPAPDGPGASLRFAGGSSLFDGALPEGPQGEASLSRGVPLRCAAGRDRDVVPV